MVLEYIEKYKVEIKKCIDDLKHKDTRYKQIPNLLTFSRAIGGPIISVLFLTGHPVIGGISIGLLFLTDALDGRLARNWNVQSEFGADLDAFCDKIMFLGLSLLLIVSNPIVLLNFILEGAISGINVFGRMKGLDTKTVFSGKVKTCFLYFTLLIGYLIQFVNIPMSWFNALVVITSFSQGFAIGDYIQEFRRMNKEQMIDVLVQEEMIADEETIVYEKKESLTEQLLREKEFYLGFKEPDVVVENTKVRRFRNEKKNGNFN